MKRFCALPILIAILMTLHCSSGKNQSSDEVMDFDTFKVKRVDLTHFSQCGTIKKVIKLETNDNSAFGSISRLIIDKKTGDILILDTESRRMVLRFNKEGKYLISYGKIGNGPSEYQDLYDFCQTENGDIILLTSHKLIKLSSTNVLLLEKRVNISSSKIETIRDKLFVLMINDQSNQKEKHAIEVYDLFFSNIGGIGQHDSRFEKYIFLANNKIATRRNQLFYSHGYDFQLNIYDSNSQKLSRLRIPSNNSALDAVWGKKNFTEADRTTIKGRLHFFLYIFPMEDDLLLYEICKDENIYSIWRLNLEKKEAIIYSYFCFNKNWQVKDQNQLRFEGILGAYDKGFIAAFFDAEEFNKYKNDYPALKDIEFNLDDNPILAFYEFNEK